MAHVTRTFVAIHPFEIANEGDAGSEGSTLARLVFAAPIIRRALRAWQEVATGEDASSPVKFLTRACYGDRAPDSPVGAHVRALVKVERRDLQNEADDFWRYVEQLRLSTPVRAMLQCSPYTVEILDGGEDVANAEGGLRDGRMAVANRRALLAPNQQPHRVVVMLPAENVQCERGPRIVIERDGPDAMNVTIVSAARNVSLSDLVGEATTAPATPRISPLRYDLANASARSEVERLFRPHSSAQTSVWRYRELWAGFNDDDACSREAFDVPRFVSVHLAQVLHGMHFHVVANARRLPRPRVRPRKRPRASNVEEDDEADEADEEEEEANEDTPTPWFDTLVVDPAKVYRWSGQGHHNALVRVPFHPCFLDCLCHTHGPDRCTVCDAGDAGDAGNATDAADRPAPCVDIYCCGRKLQPDSVHGHVCPKHHTAYATYPGWTVCTRHLVVRLKCRHATTRNGARSTTLRVDHDVALTAAERARLALGVSSAIECHDAAYAHVGEGGRSTRAALEPLYASLFDAKTRLDQAGATSEGAALSVRASAAARAAEAAEAAQAAQATQATRAEEAEEVEEVGDAAREESGAATVETISELARTGRLSHFYGMAAQLMADPRVELRVGKRKGLVSVDSRGAARIEGVVDPTYTEMRLTVTGSGGCRTRIRHPMRASLERHVGRLFPLDRNWMAKR